MNKENNRKTKTKKHIYNQVKIATFIKSNRIKKNKVPFFKFLDFSNFWTRLKIYAKNM